MTMETSETETQEPTLSPQESPEPETEAPKTETKPSPQEAPAPEPKPEPKPEPTPKSSAPEPDVKPCKFTAEGTFDKGIADCKVTKNSKIELDRTQIIVLVQDGKRYTYNRINIEPIQK